MDTQTPPVLYVALRPLVIPNAPGSVPSSIRVKAGERFELDGDEPIDLPLLIQQHAVRVWDSSETVPQVVETERDRRRARRQAGSKSR